MRSITIVRNITPPERVVRAIIGLGILGLYGALTPPWRYLALIGLIPLGTALTGVCPVYRMIGWNRTQPPGRAG